MDSVLWDELAPLFERASQLSGSDRKTFLQSIKEQNKTLWKELISLLESADDADSFLGDLAQIVPPIADTDDDRDDPYKLLGRRLSKYEIIEILGTGGMGVVYKAKDVELGRYVALKFLPPALSMDARARERFTTEARAASALDHVNVCTIHEIGRTQEGQVFIAMAYYQGETIKQKIERGPLAPDEVLSYVSQIASGLEMAHASTIIHRDIKPGNIMVTSNGVVKILDFGLAKFANQQLTQTGMAMGTISYMSPEQIKGNEVTPSTDIWALGVMMYEMLYGQRPFPGEYRDAIMYGIVNQKPAPAKPVGHFIEAIIERCLQKDPASRYRRVGALLEELHETRNPGNRATFWSKNQLDPNYLLLGVLGVLVVVLAWPIVSNITGNNNQKTELANEKRIALLPFRAVPEENEEDQVLAEGLMYVLADMLAKLDSPEHPLWVVPISKVDQYNVQSPAEAAEMLGANVVLEGVMERLRDVVALSLNLIDPNEQQLIGAETSLIEDSALSDDTDRSLQERLLEKLAFLLEIPTDEAKELVLTIHQPTDPDAYAYYLQGVGYLQRFDRPGYIDFAIQQFNQSLDQDSLYAPSHAGLCEALLEKYLSTSDASFADQALQSCDRAAEIANDQPEVLVPLASVYLRTGAHQQAEETLRRAIEIKPDDAEAHHWLGRLFDERNMVDSAIVAYEKAIVLKPNVWLYYHELGTLLSFHGQHEAAAVQFEHVPESYPRQLPGP